jgi:uncharacterized protein (DUF2062 family)
LSAVAGLLTRWRSRLRELWHRAKTERASPREIGLAIALGVFIGCTPALMVHGWIAVGLATLFKLNRLFAFLGSRVSNFLVLPWIVLAELQIAHKLRTGAFLEMTADEAIKQGPALLLDWCLGTIPVGAALALVLGALAYAFARRRESRRLRNSAPAS